VNERIVEDYRRHQIVAAAHESTFVGKAWKDGKCVLDVRGESLDEVLIALRIGINRLLESRADSEPPADAKAYAAALKKILPVLTDGHLAMLKIHYSAPDRCITATELANAAGYANYRAANLQYGSVGKLLWEEIPRRLPIGANGEPIYTFAIAEAGGDTESEDQWVWRMRPEMAAAIQELGLDT